MARSILLLCNANIMYVTGAVDKIFIINHLEI